jgi:hypothetical protein
VIRTDFFFAKAHHVYQESNKTVGITGWSAKKGVQPKNKAVENFISGQTRPSGSAVAFRTQLLKQYRYDKNLASLSDFYLNNLNLMIEVQGNFFHCNPTMKLENSRKD